MMRLEKGFLHFGTDTDGSTVPDDVGWGKVAADKSADFIGKRSLLLPENIRADRLQLVGLTSLAPIIVGSHVRLQGSTQATDGWVTSAGRDVLTVSRLRSPWCAVVAPDGQSSCTMPEPWRGRRS